MKAKNSPFGLLEFENLAGVPGIIHFVTTRSGGISSPPYNSLNLGLHTADNGSDVIENRRLLAAETGIDVKNFLYASQVHSGDVKVIDKKAVSESVLSLNPLTDAMITDIPGICLMVMVADCVPVVLFDPVRKVSAVIHAGWRGTVQLITAHTVSKMISHFGCNPENIIAGIGPSIGACCYEVGEEVTIAVQKSFNTTDGYLLRQNTEVKPRFDLWFANQKQLTVSGLKSENIETAGLCTQCNSGIFFSSRASQGITGRFAAGICIV